jgi:Acetoacetate decarboxylase (ADC)
MPIFGALDHQRLLPRAPRVEDLASAPSYSASVETVVFAAEIPSDVAVEITPQALNPVMPPYARVELRKHYDSPWGPFSTACLAIACRANGAARVFVTGGFCDDDQAIEYLRLHYGARMKRAAISIERRYSGIEGRVASEGRLVFDAVMEKPEPIDSAQVMQPASLHLAKFEGQLTLIEEDKDFGIVSAERGITLLRKFEAEAFGEERILLRHALPAVFIKSSLTYQPVTAMIDPALPAAAGTRTIKPPG